MDARLGGAGSESNLPVGIDHSALAVADDVAVPAPSLRIDGLADRAKHAQRGAVVLLHVRILSRN